MVLGRRDLAGNIYSAVLETISSKKELGSSLRCLRLDETNVEILRVCKLVLIQCVMLNCRADTDLF